MFLLVGLGCLLRVLLDLLKLVFQILDLGLQLCPDALEGFDLFPEDLVFTERKLTCIHYVEFFLCLRRQIKLERFVPPGYFSLKCLAIKITKVSPSKFVDLCDEIILDDIERVLCGQELVVLGDQVLHLLAHA